MNHLRTTTTTLALTLSPSLTLTLTLSLTLTLTLTLTLHLTPNSNPNPNPSPNSNQAFQKAFAHPRLEQMDQSYTELDQSPPVILPQSGTSDGRASARDSTSPPDYFPGELS